MKDEEVVRREEIRKRLKTQNLREIQKDYPASIGSLARFRDGHSPQNHKIRAALKLPIYKQAKVCPECGVVYSKVCRPSFEKRCKDRNILLWYVYLKYKIR